LLQCSMDTVSGQSSRGPVRAMSSGRTIGDAHRRRATVGSFPLHEPWVDERALARYFSVTPRTIRRWAAAGMPSRRFGGARRFRISEAERWHEQESTG
jgi:hypothetical protein